MRSEERDTAYPWGILDAARQVREFVRGVTPGDYMRDRMRQLAVERAVETVGEAARLVSESFRARHPQIPWRLIIAQRNVLAHE